MVVYADILILVNFVVDYFLLLFTSKLLHKKTRVLRLIASAAAGGFFSLYIFLPQKNFLLETAAHILMCGIMCFIAFKMRDFKDFLRSAVFLFGVNFAYSGAMIAVWYLFKPNGMVINNSVIYFNVSPVFLIVFSVVGYFAVTVLRRIIAKTFPQNVKCGVTLCCFDKSLNLCGIADTGNSVKDAFGLSEIFITEPRTIDTLLGTDKTSEQCTTRYRAIPCNTVTGSEILDGYRIDKAVVIYNNRKFYFKNPVLAASRVALDDCDVIVNPEILN